MWLLSIHGGHILFRFTLWLNVEDLVAKTVCFADNIRWAIYANTEVITKVYFCFTKDFHPVLFIFPFYLDTPILIFSDLCMTTPPIQHQMLLEWRQGLTFFIGPEMMTKMYVFKLVMLLPPEFLFAFWLVMSGCQAGATHPPWSSSAKAPGDFLPILPPLLRWISENRTKWSKQETST